MLAVRGEARSQSAQLGDGARRRCQVNHSDRIASDGACSVNHARHCMGGSEPRQADTAVPLVA